MSDNILYGNVRMHVGLAYDAVRRAITFATMISFHVANS
jgi:hypothetical protein